MKKRPSWDEYFLKIAKIVATSATCLRRQVGAVLVKNKQILATGYNGAPSKLPHCEVTGCLREQLGIKSGERHELCRGLHAEHNAIIQAAVHGVSIKDSILYLTNQPCIICTKMIINAGIREIVYAGDYPDQMSRDFLSQAKIKTKRVKL